MQGIKSILIVQIVLMAFATLYLSGCAAPEKYTYDGIRQEYAAAICYLTPLESAPVKKEMCVLSGPVSLTGAIEIAKANNPDQRMAVSRIEQAEAMIDRADAAFWPWVGVYTEYVQGDAPSGYLFKKIDQRKLPNVDFNYPGWFENYETGVKARMNLYNGGKDLLHKRMAGTGLAISQLDRQSVENALIASVIHIYYDCLAAGDYIKIAEESVASVKTELRVMKVKFDAGGVLKSDILSLEVRLAQALEDVVLSENRLKTSLAALANVLGVSPGIEIVPSEADIRELPIPATYDDGVMHALAYRPEIQKAREQVVRSRMALDLSRAGYLPRIDWHSGYYVDDSEMAYNTNRENWTTGILFNWDLFTGFSTRADEKRAEALLKEMLAADRQSVLSIKLDVKNAYLKADEAKARFEVTQKSVAMAEESLKLVKIQYEGGSATITRFLEAELARNRARIRATASFYDQEKARADIGRAIGYWGDATEKKQGHGMP